MVIWSVVTGRFFGQAHVFDFGILTEITFSSKFGCNSGKIILWELAHLNYDLVTRINTSFDWNCFIENKYFIGLQKKMAENSKTWGIWEVNAKIRMKTWCRKVSFCIIINIWLFFVQYNCNICRDDLYACISSCVSVFVTMYHF